ncbi:DUSP domain protein [Toxoplasma gondii CAST]|uniref:DUSP domain protein n=1 Tax=Toxoplasma gondii CAST TaxID=943122 RepID=A0A3R7YWY7_TOXGO|nr:DUSP domain protein [Toxoplasma gondii CAST]
MEQTDTESGCRYGGTAAGRRASGAETFFSSAFAGKEDADTRWRPNGDVCHWQKGIPPAPDVQALESKSRGCRRRDTGESCPQTFREQEFQQRGSRGEAKRQSGGVWERRLLDGNVETDRRTETDESKLQCMRGWQRQSGRKESSLAQTPPRATDSASMAAVNDCEKRSNAEDLSDTWGEVPFENLSEASLDTALEVYVHSSKGMGKHEGKTKKSDGIRIKPTTPSFEWLGGVAQRVEGSFNFFTSTFADFALRAEELLGERTAPPRAFAAETGEASAVRAAPHHEARFLKNQTEARKIDAEVCGETAVAPLFAESAFAGTQRQVGFLSIETPDKQAKHEDLLHKDKESEQEERRRDHEREWTSFRVGALDGEASPTHRCDGKQETPGKTPEKLPHGRETREESFFDSSERRRQSWSSVVHPQVLDSPASVHAAVSACDIFPRSEPTRLHSFSSPSSGASDSPGPLLPSPIAASPSPSTSVLPHSLLFPEDRSDSLSPARRDRRGWGAEAVCVSQAHRRQLLLAASRFAASAETQPTEGSSDTQNTKHEETLESARTQAHAAFLPLTSPLFTEEELTVWSSTKCGLCGQQVLQEDLASHSAICNVAASADEYSVIHEDKFLASASALPEEDRRNYVAERRLEEALEGLCLVRRWGCGESSEDCLRRLQSSLEEKLKEVRNEKEERIRQRRQQSRQEDSTSVERLQLRRRVCVERRKPPVCAGDPSPLGPVSPVYRSSSPHLDSACSETSVTNPSEAAAQSFFGGLQRREEAREASDRSSAFVSDMLHATHETSATVASLASRYQAAFASALASLPRLSPRSSSLDTKPVCFLSHSSPRSSSCSSSFPSSPSSPSALTSLPPPCPSARPSSFSVSAPPSHCSPFSSLSSPSFSSSSPVSCSPSSSSVRQQDCEEPLWWMPGTFGFVIDSGWMRTWFFFTGLANPGEDGLLELRLPALWTDPSFDHPRLYCGRPPGPITNKSLLDVKGKIVAGRQRGLNADYLILDASAWTFLHQRYGGGPPIILYNPNPCEFGDLYEGCFVTFEGEWQNGHPYTGKGKVFDPLCNRGFDGELREGRLWNVKPGSKGLLPDGGILLGGACIQGKIHGPNGKLLRRRKLYVGKFRKGKLHGHGLVARAEDGVVLAEGVWENGKLCGI